MTATQIVALRAPQYAADIRLPDFVTLATMLTAESFGDRREYAIALRVLHMMSMEALHGGTGSTYSGTGASGGVVSESEGQLSRSFGSSGAATAHNGDLSSTAYGLELMELAEMTFFKPRTRMML